MSLLIVATLMLSACSSQSVRMTPAASTETAALTGTPEPASPPQPTTTSLPSLSATPSSTATRLPALLPLDATDWKNWPVIPIVPEAARLIYLRGQELGNDPHAFSIFGDCQSEPDVFLGVYETDPQKMTALPPELQETVAYFAGSFNRPSPTVQVGTTAGALLWMEWHHRKYGCLAAETPVDCELRIHNPSFVIIHVGTHVETRNIEYLRRILERLIERGVVPILGTMADDRSPEVNHEYAMLAVEYNIPLWNFWPAIGGLPNRGLYTNPDEPNLGDIYLTDEAIEIHRYTALQALDAVWRAVTGSH